MRLSGPIVTFGIKANNTFQVNVYRGVSEKEFFTMFTTDLNIYRNASVTWDPRSMSVTISGQKLFVSRAFEGESEVVAKGWESGHIPTKQAGLIRKTKVFSKDGTMFRFGPNECYAWQGNTNSSQLVVREIS